MDNTSIKSRNIEEYTVPMVSIDGESHSAIILVAVVSGIVVASIILTTLGILLKRRQKIKMPSEETMMKSSACGNKRRIFTIFQHRQSVDFTTMKKGYSENGRDSLNSFRTIFMNEMNLKRGKNVEQGNVISRYYGQNPDVDLCGRETLPF